MISGQYSERFDLYRPQFHLKEDCDDVLSLIPPRRPMEREDSTSVPRVYVTGDKCSFLDRNIQFLNWNRITCYQKQLILHKIKLAGIKARRRNRSDNIVLLPSIVNGRNDANIHERDNLSRCSAHSHLTRSTNMNESTARQKYFTAQADALGPCQTSPVTNGNGTKRMDVVRCTTERNVCSSTRETSDGKESGTVNRSLHVGLDEECRNKSCLPSLQALARLFPEKHFSSRRVSSSTLSMPSSTNPASTFSDSFSARSCSASVGVADEKNNGKNYSEWNRILLNDASRKKSLRLPIIRNRNKEWLARSNLRSNGEDDEHVMEMVFYDLN